MKRINFVPFAIFLLVVNWSCKDEPPTTAQNRPPVIQSLFSSPTSSATNRIPDSTLITLSVIATDEDANTLRFSWYAASGNFVSGQKTATAVWKPPQSPADEEDTLYVTVNDGVEFVTASMLIFVGKASGSPWVAFTTTNSPLPDNVINEIYVDNESRVWIATNEGAAYFKDNSWGIIRDSLKYFIYTSGGIQIPAYNVTSITQGKDRSIWFGLRGGGVVRYNQFSQTGNIWTRYLNSEFIISLEADISDATINGEMWIVAGGGLNRFVLNSTDGGVWHYYQSPQIPSNQNTVAVRGPFDNSIWIGSVSNGMLLILYDPFFTIYTIPLPAGYVGKITGIAFDGDRNVWVSKDIGISNVNLDSGLWTHYNSASTNGKLPPGNVNAVASDLGSNRWFGTDAGLVHLVDTTWSVFTTANSLLPGNTVTSVEYDGLGNLWIGTTSGVAVYNPAGTRF